MATERFDTSSTASAGVFRVYGRSGSQAGKVYDFADGTWKTLAAATTPYTAGTKVADYFGTGNHQFYKDLNLALLNNTGAVMRYGIALFAGATPAVTDAPDGQVLEFAVVIGKLTDQPPVTKCERSSSTLGDTLQLSVWLEHLGQKVDLSAVDGSAACRVIAREHGAASGTLTFDTDDPAVTFTMRDDILEGSVTTDPNNDPIGFTDNVNYMIETTITENGNTHSAIEIVPWWGA